MTDTLVILAGGVSSRMKKSSAGKEVSSEKAKEADSKSKGLIGLGKKNRPIMDYLLYNAKQAGIKNIVILNSPKNKEMFHKQYGAKETDNDFHGLKISFATQYIPEDREKPLGTADALYQAMDQREKLKEKQFLVCNSDNLYSPEAFQLLIEDDHPNAWVDYDRSGFDFSQKRIEAFSVTDTDEDGYLKDIIEKPEKKDVSKYADEDGKIRVSMNLFKFVGEMIFTYVRDCPIDPKRNEKELPTAILNMVADNPRSMYGIPHREHVPDLTRKKDILKVQEYIEEKYQDLSW
jgi:glucose-1-phosphate adenylyltransferase